MLATIQVPSSASTDFGGRKTTFLPTCKGCFAMPSFLDLGSRVCGPTEFVLGGTVMETERVFPRADATGIGVPDGE